jgi:hypothetical protein
LVAGELEARWNRALVRADDDVIAGILNRNGLKTGNGNRWTRERVTSMRSNHRLRSIAAPRTGWSRGST